MTTSNDNQEMTLLAGRAERLIGALTDALLSASEAAAERISLASEVAKVQQRMSAFASVLEVVDAQKQALLARMANANGPMRALLEHQIAMLTAQETGILERCGIASRTAQLAVKTADQGEPLYRREGKRFERVSLATPASKSNGTNGHADPSQS